MGESCGGCGGLVLGSEQSFKKREEGSDWGRREGWEGRGGKVRQAGISDAQTASESG